MRQTSRSTVEFSAAELKRLLRTLDLLYKIGDAIGYGPPDGEDAEEAAMAIESILERRGVCLLRRA